MLKRIAWRDLHTVAPSAVNPELLTSVAAIVEQVRRQGEAGLRAAIEQFERRPSSAQLVYGPSDLQAAWENLPVAEQELLERVRARIQKFAEAQRTSLSNVDLKVEGGRAGHLWHPLRTAGCYVPGGRFSLVSSVLMTCVPARVAGVEQITVASPDAKPLMLAAAWLAGADRFLHAGGAQAIAALAWGTCLPACDIVVGPGNQWVTAAKYLLSGEVRVDLLAGPSELLLVADESARPDWVAADLLAQAEHDPQARSILITTSKPLANDVDRQIECQLRSLPTREIAQRAIGEGWSLIVSDLEEARKAVEQVAPEHLALHLREAPRFASLVRNCGCVFIGADTPVALGDYGAGPNHVLPTGRTARFASGLAIDTFLRRQFWLSVDPLLRKDPAEIQDRRRLADPISVCQIANRDDASEPDPTGGFRLAGDATALAQIEGLPAHAYSIQLRQAKWMPSQGRPDPSGKTFP